MRLSFLLRVFLLLGVWILPACAEAATPTAAPTPTMQAAGAAPAEEKPLRFVEFFSPM